MVVVVVAAVVVTIVVEYLTVVVAIVLPRIIYGNLLQSTVIYNTKFCMLCSYCRLIFFDFLGFCVFLGFPRIRFDFQTFVSLSLGPLDARRILCLIHGKL